MNNKSKSYYKIRNKALAPIPVDQRIYLKVDYKPRRFATESGCRFDPMKNLWFTGIHNPLAESMINHFGIHEQTSENALELLKKHIEQNKKQ